MEPHRVERLVDPTDAAAIGDAIWIDLLDPDDAMRARVEAVTGLYVLSHGDTTEIESSSRSSAENGVLFLTMPVIARSAEGETVFSSIGFVLARQRLITIRFATVPPLEVFADRVGKLQATERDAAHLFVGLLEALADGMADVLERTRAELDGASRRIFGTERGGASVRNNQLRETLALVGRLGDLLSSIRDSQLAFGRLVHFVGHAAADRLQDDLQPRMQTLRQDISSLADYDSHLSNKAQFLLDAILGFINIDQSNTIKVMTVVGVVGVPPTLIASIYGMNFEVMPELRLAWGYPMALGLMALSAIIPVLWFRRRGWL
jgi:magnesium transporter